MDKRRTSAFLGPQKLSLTRTVVSLLLLAAFALQSYAVQTHLHFHLPAGAVQSSAVRTSGGRLPQGPSHQNDPAHCLLCQAMLAGGSYVIPPAVKVYLPTDLFFFVPVRNLAQLFMSPPSHLWRGRAPPTSIGSSRVSA